MPKSAQPTFRCRFVPRARDNSRKVKRCRKIINNFYLGNSQFVNIKNTNYNLFSLFKYGNESSGSDKSNEIVKIEGTSSSEADRSFCHLEKTNLNDPFNFSNNSKTYCDQQITVRSGISTNFSQDLMKPPNQLDLISDENRYQSSNKNVLCITENTCDNNQEGEIDRSGDSTIDNVASMFRRIALKETTNHAFAPRDIKGLIANTPANVLSNFGKMIRFDMTKNGAKGKVEKKCITYKARDEKQTRYADESRILSSTTSTPVTLKENYKGKNWELSPITFGRDRYSETADVSNKINATAKVLQYDDSEPQMNDVSEDIFDWTNLFDDNQTEQSKSLKSSDGTNQNTTIESKLSDHSDVNESQGDMSSFQDLYNTARSDSINEMFSRDDTLNKNDPQRLSFREIRYSNAVEPNEPLTLKDQSAQRHSKSLTNENNSLCFSNEPFETTDLEINSSFESDCPEPRKHSDGPDCYTNIIPGKKWRRSLLAAGNKKRITMVTDKFLQQEFSLTRDSWNIRFSVNPKKITEQSFHKNYPNKLCEIRQQVSDERNQQAGKLVEYDSIIDYTILDESQVSRTDCNEELDCTMKIHQQVSHMLQKDDLMNRDKSEVAKEKVLNLCCNKSPVEFDGYVANLKNCKKVGEGMYGEVYSFYKDIGQTVLKVIPIEGDKLVNSTPQKTYSDVFSEICIALSLSNLKNIADNCTEGFCSILNITCLKGKYPWKLVNVWDQFDMTTGSENDSPIMFEQNQLYIALEMLPGGEPLGSYEFCSARQSYSILLQVIHSLAVAEQAYEFEHRDLHWGNVLISKTSLKNMNYTIDGKPYSVATYARKATIIDYTLSRIRSGKFDIYNDLEMDKEVFQAYGDYQFDIYRDMRKDVNSHWEVFEPKTNVRWIHYLAAKCYQGVYYSTMHKTHESYLHKIKTMRDKILDYASATEIVTNLIHS